MLGEWEQGGESTQGRFNGDNGIWAGSQNTGRIFTNKELQITL